MIKIGLDLAIKTCGVAVLDEKQLFCNSHIIKDGKECSSITQYDMTVWVWNQILPYLQQPHVLILEDIFKGDFDILKYIARVQGAIVDRYILETKRYPVFTMATTARTRVKLPISAPKVHIQLWAINTFKLKSIDENFQKQVMQKVNRYYEINHSKNKNDKKVKKELLKLLTEYSKKVHIMTNIDEHIADAIVLASGG